MTHILQPPKDLDLQVGEHPVVTFMTFSQYPAVGEVVRDGHWRCSVNWSSEGQHSVKDKPFMIVDAEIIYRQPLQLLAAEPPNERPRLYGSNTEWFSQRVEPFFQAPCEVGAEHRLVYFSFQYWTLEFVERKQLDTASLYRCNGMARHVLA